MVPIQEIRERIKDLWGDQIAIKDETYVDGRSRATFVDAVYGEFVARVDGVLYFKQGHPQRGYVSRQQKKTTPIEEVKRRLLIAHKGDVIIDESTYKTLRAHADFIHKEHGRWTACPASVLKGRSHPLEASRRYKETMTRLYGSPHPSQCSGIALKAARNLTSQVFVAHWKTGEPVRCTASYEYAIVNHLNELRLDYDSQIRFQLSGSVYFCDFYVKDWDLYLEVKGYMRDRSREKWEEFHAAHPNSELWELEKVKEFTMKTEYRLTKDFKTALMAANDQAVPLLLREPTIPPAL